MANIKFLLLAFAIAAVTGTTLPLTPSTIRVSSDANKATESQLPTIPWLTTSTPPPPPTTTKAESLTPANHVSTTDPAVAESTGPLNTLSNIGTRAFKAFGVFEGLKNFTLSGTNTSNTSSILRTAGQIYINLTSDPATNSSSQPLSTTTTTTDVPPKSEIPEPVEDFDIPQVKAAASNLFDKLKQKSRSWFSFK